MQRFLQFLAEDQDLQIEIPESPVGQHTSIHPVVKVAPTSADYMKWSYRLGGKHAGDAETIHIRNVRCVINHKVIDRTIRNPEDGRKRPIILLEGEIVDINFPLIDIHTKLSDGGGWESITYNPHKHPEYVSRRGLPSWWCSEAAFQDKTPRSDFNIERREAMVEYAQHPDQPRAVTHKQGEKSILVCDEAILKQHKTCNEDYMWIKGHG